MSTSPKFFSVHLLWHTRDGDTDWELETEHHGFSNPIAAALFAEGVSDPAIAFVLTDGRGGHLHTSDGRRIALTEESPDFAAAPPTPLGIVRGRAWRQKTSDDSRALVTTDDFDEKPLGDLLCEKPGRTEWVLVARDVRGAAGSVDVTLTFDRTGEFLEAEIEDDAEVPASPDEIAAIALIPRA
jgi:hypothetical protein